MSHGAAVVGLTLALAQGSLQLPSPGPLRPGTGTADDTALAPLSGSSRRADPFAGLFAGPSQTPPARQAPGATPPDVSPPGNPPPAHRVVCGMTVVTVDPAVDPHMPRRTPPADRAYTIRATPPPICRD